MLCTLIQGIVRFRFQGLGATETFPLSLRMYFQIGLLHTKEVQE